MRHLLLMTLAAVMAFAGGQSDAASPKIIINATLLSPERSAPLLDAWVRIDEGTITSLGTGTIDTSGLEVIDAADGYLIPGPIDSHVHLYHATGLKRRYADNFDALYGAFMDQQPRSFLYFGFTSVIELNAKAEANRRFEAAPVHPRLYHCGQGVILSDGFMALDLEGAPIEQFYPGYLIDHHTGGYVPGEFNRSSQHSGIGGCYDGTQTAVGSVWTEQVAFARSTGLGTA